MKLTREDSAKVSKHGIDICVYDVPGDEVGFVSVEVEEGHFQEYYNKKSTLLYYITEGEGNFYLNGKETPVKATDLLVVPPMTKIYYLGKMKLTLTTVPAWKEEDEVHVRFIEKNSK
jgi:mannose-6-phosphate isomerase-like protein (cupin superfamily)